MDVEQRASFHAALGDPARLTIVDSLFLTDLSPGDLARRLGLPSNLLAHHLRVLESAGIIERRRSEGDGRRSYVRLRSEHPILRALDLAAPFDGADVAAAGGWRSSAPTTQPGHSWRPRRGERSVTCR